MHRFALLLALLAFPSAVQAQVPENPVAPARDTEPIILKGAALDACSFPANHTL